LKKHQYNPGGPADSIESTVNANWAPALAGAGEKLKHNEPSYKIREIVKKEGHKRVINVTPGEGRGLSTTFFKYKPAEKEE